MVNFLTVAAKHCRQAEHAMQLVAGSFNWPNGILIIEVDWRYGSISHPQSAHWAGFDIALLC
jgi:hypothetical protein